MTIESITTVALANIISGIFIGAGISIGFYVSMKKQMPKWIKEITNELTKSKNIDKALKHMRGLNE